MFQNTNITKATGIHDLYLVAHHLRGTGDIDWIVFSKNKALKNSLAPAPLPESSLHKSVEGKHYFIDSEKGNHSYNGRSPENAWKSHTMIATNTFEPGDGDPRLVNLMGSAFNLTSESPLRGKAINLLEFYQVDFNGTVLIKSGVWDVGALQFK